MAAQSPTQIASLGRRDNVWAARGHPCLGPIQGGWQCLLTLGITEQVQGVTSNSKDFRIPEFEVQLCHFLMIDLDIHVNL